MELGVFDHVADALLGLVPDDLGVLRVAPRRWGLKVWFDDDACPRVHYEAQVVPARLVPDAEVLALELGFHAEHPKEPDNVAVLAPLLAAEARWRRMLGEPAVAGPFLGNARWRRISETWADPDLSDPELCFELADRLAGYVAAIEPLRARAISRRDRPRRGGRRPRTAARWRSTDRVRGAGSGRRPRRAPAR